MEISYWILVNFANQSAREDRLQKFNIDYTNSIALQIKVYWRLCFASMFCYFDPISILLKAQAVK